MTPYSLMNGVHRAFTKKLPEILGGSFEPRRHQSHMASAVAELLQCGGVAVVEAGTGLGKSLAYLVPLVLHCERSGQRAVVSTYTRNLQRQLIDKDFPLACAAAGAHPTGVALMGRGNYLCRNRAEKRVSARGRRAGADTTPENRRWLRSALADEAGELDALPGASRVLDAALRASLASPTRDTVCAGCRQRHECFMLRARRRALDAKVIVTNHALLFSNLASSGALLGPYDVLVVDEAHHLEDVATDFLSVSYSPRSVLGGANSVYSPEVEETVKYVRAMVADQSQEDARTLDSAWKVFRDSMNEADRATAELFRLLGQNVAGLLRGAEPSNGGFENVQVTYGEGSPLMYGVESTSADVSRALGRMETAAASMAGVAERLESVGEGGAFGAVRAIRDGAAETKAALDFLVSGAADDHVFYARVDAPSSVVELTASPVDVSDQMGAVLEEGCRATLLTSATLAVDGDFSYTLARLGLDAGGATTRRYESPFDFDRCRLVLLPAHLPEPSHASFLPEAAALIEASVAASGRRALVLCTARSQVAALGRLLSRSAGLEPLLQTEGASREDLLERFRRSRLGVLVGLASFWEGVDLPGDELELLFVLKLPFKVPTEPVAMARAKRVEEAGESPFEKLYLPDVVLKLRQGMGRLIRAGRDRGAVILLDRRLIHSRYGGHVLRSVTERYVRCDGSEDAVERLLRHFNDS
jgi:ATP-dependent DNA helicase DinG